MDDETHADGVTASDPDHTDAIRWASPDEESPAADEPPIPSWLETRGDGLAAAIMLPEAEVWAPAPETGAPRVTALDPAVDPDLGDPNLSGPDLDGPDLDGEVEVDLGDDPWVDESEVDALEDESDAEPDAVVPVTPAAEPADGELDRPIGSDDEPDAAKEPAAADGPALVAVPTDDDARDDVGETSQESDDESDDEWVDEVWGPEEEAFASAVWSSRPARIMTIVAVVMIVVLLMSTVLLWQRLEDVKADVNTVPTTQPVPDPQLAELRRRLSRLETQVASTFDASGNVVGATDALRAELAALRQCVAAFQQQLVQNQSDVTVIC